MNLPALAVLANGIGAVQDLPVPAWLFYYGAALVLVASFVALGVLWREPRMERGKSDLYLPDCNGCLRPVPLQVECVRHRRITSPT